MLQGHGRPGMEKDPGRLAMGQPDAEGRVVTWRNWARRFLLGFTSEHRRVQAF